MATIINKVPDDYRETKLYKQLVNVSTVRQDGLCANVDKLISKIQPILETVGREAFGDYTLHSPLHSRKLLHLAGYIIPDEVLARLSSLELTVMIMSFYLHDLGMVLLYNDKANILASTDFQTFIETKENFSSKFSAIREEIKKSTGGQRSNFENVLSQLQNTALTEYLRPQHASIERYNIVLDNVLDEADCERLFQLDGVSFKEELLKICQSHNEPSVRLGTVENLTGKMAFDVEHYLCQQEFNMQYCAAILRIADILDFDMERTPSSLFRAIGIEDKQLPGFKISLKEWTKQMSVHTICISDNEIQVKAVCNSPSVEHAVRMMCITIEREICDTLSIIRSAKADVATRYYINLPQTVRADISSIGYTYKDYSIHLNEDAIKKLLMGTNLYVNNYVAVRELIQNAIDACQIRNHIEKFAYTPLVKVYISVDANHRRWLVVQDNGIGMDDKVLSNYFFKIGNSYYRSEEFKTIQKEKKIKDFFPTSRFGIGILSVFMIGNVVKVTTSNKYSSRNDTLQRTLIIENTESLAVVQERPATENGTKIEVQLHTDKDNENFINGLLGTVKEYIIRPSVPVMITALDKSETRIDPSGYYRLSPNAILELENYGICPIEIDLSKHSTFLKGRAYFFFFEKENGKLSFIDPNGVITWGIYPLKPSNLFIGTATESRVTVNGVTMSLRKSGSLFNTKKRIVPSLIDVDIISKDEITFDVSRTRVNGKGLEVSKREIYNSIVESLKEQGIYDRFDEETCKQFERARIRNVSTLPLNQEFLAKVEELLPNSSFHVSEEVVSKVAGMLAEDYSIVKKYVHAVAQKYKK